MIRPNICAGCVLVFAVLAGDSVHAQELTIEALHNATYESIDPFIGRVTLEDCFANDYESGRKVHGTNHVDHADFDQDGLEDAVTIVSYKRDRRTESSLELVVMKNDHGRPRQLTSVRLGRVLVRELRVDDDVIYLDMATNRVCDERGCRFTDREVNRYILRDGEILLRSSRTTSLEPSESSPSFLTTIWSNLFPSKTER